MAAKLNKLAYHAVLYSLRRRFWNLHRSFSVSAASWITTLESLTLAWKSKNALGNLKLAPMPQSSSCHLTTEKCVGLGPTHSIDWQQLDQ